MAQTARETAIAALYALITGAAPFNGFPTMSRRLVHWDKLLEEQRALTETGQARAVFPAIYVASGAERRLPAAKQGLPAAWALEVKVYLYNHDATPGAVVETVRNGYLDALEAAIAPTTPNNLQTLGGLVRDVRIADAADIVTDEGILGEIGLSITPVWILLTK